MDKFFTVMAFDPGGCTGYAIGTVEADSGRFHFEYAGAKAYHEYAELYGMLESISPLYVVAESFEFRKNSQRHGIVLESRNVLGVLQLWCEIRDSHFCLQTPAVGKAFVTDAKLREKGVYTTGSGHANDATRHLLRWWFFGAGSQFRLKSK